MSRVMVSAAVVLSTVAAAEVDASSITVRFATFNTSLNRNVEGELIQNLSTPDDPQAQVVAEIIQRVRPEVLLINEFDFDADGEALRLFQENYLGVSQNGQEPIHYPFSFLRPSNTGVASGFDLDNNGVVGTEVGTFDYANDAFGFGFFPGQFAMVVVSQLPILEEEARTFQTFLARDVPDALLPDDPDTPEPDDFYSPEELDIFRLSSKSHWDVPVQVGEQVVHFLVAHPTPPVFDGPEDRNGTRNHDEIRLFADYVQPGMGDYLVDDNGVQGGLAPGELFVIAGDMNADPFDGDSTADAALQITQNPRINNAVAPRSFGGVDDAARDGGINDTHIGDPRFDTADFGDDAPGNLRVDYVLPSETLFIRQARVAWPPMSSPNFRLVGDDMIVSSDHRLVFVDVGIPIAD